MLSTKSLKRVKFHKSIWLSYSINDKIGAKAIVELPGFLSKNTLDT